MANRSEPSMIIEGFLCPECQQDMSTIELLQAHFELVHSSRAKKANAALPNHQSDSKLSQNAQSVASSKFLKQFFNSDQNDGYFKSHTDQFKKFRDNTIGRYVVQTNKLLITLDKMISVDSTVLSDDSKRENHFKSIVEWVSDKDVQLCPNCAKTFGLITRKHHCRLCGAIMCNKCSKFISFKHAKLLTDPDIFIKAQNKPEEIEFKLKRSDSITSINSYFFKSTQSAGDGPNQKSISSFDQMHLRLCLNCGLILEKKYNIQKDKIIRPEFASLYDINFYLN
ncbi:rabenosyn-5-like [Brachionus plicatilis]|uniref:Rabenosyn-5-like n=1 Tax=Brachionus plicatilis TaxID=10195 RepID=A0A3M7T082_BRAPC|nr:rabenosyn-5-like [Brachionus plicatilis]